MPSEAAKAATKPIHEEMEVDVVKTPDTSEDVKDIDGLTVEDVRDCIRLIEKGVSSKEDHFMTRTVRMISAIRPKLNHNVLRSLVSMYYQKDSVQRAYFMEFLPEIMETDSKQAATRTKMLRINPNAALESEVFLHLLLLIYLLDRPTSGQYKEDAIKCADLLVAKLVNNTKRSLATLAAQCYFYYSRAYDLVGRLQDIRPFLHARLRTATLRNHTETNAVLINLLLHNYLHYHLYDQAYKLVSRVVFPESASNNKWARYLYYVGRIKAIQLDYSTAHDHLVSALRKAPQHSAIGFKQTLHKLNTVVELLLGDMPDRATFRDLQFRDALEPYFKLTQAIHAGDLTQFNKVLHTYGGQFTSDETYSLIVRLRHNVIKTAVRRISLSYSRITLQDVAKKLQLDSAKDAEYIVAKAIRDGVIDAVINHEEGFVTTKETLDLYSTREPMDQLRQRIKFCLGIRNQAVRAMRYPPKQYNKDLESAEERREREQQELESAKEFTEDDFDLL